MIFSTLLNEYFSISHLLLAEGFLPVAEVILQHISEFVLFCRTMKAGMV